MRVDLIEVDYPLMEIPPEIPRVPTETYQQRVKDLQGKMGAVGLTHVIVYADREHFANLKFLTRFDPRFEEALLIVPAEGKPILVVGNEGLDYAAIAYIPVDVVLYHPFSLQGQPRRSEHSLVSILAKAGINKDSCIGVVGHKYMENDEFGDPEQVSDLPSYLVDTFRGLVGKSGLRNVTQWFTHPTTGLRIPLTVDEIARCEVIGLKVYNGFRAALNAMKIGVSEVELGAQLGYDGQIPLSCHIAIGFGEHGQMGLASPTLRKLEHGEFVSMGFGVWGANIARSGIAVAHPNELPEEINDALDRVYIPYFKALLAWYQSIRVGVTAGEVYESVRGLMEDSFFGITLNAGHQARDEEWINSPFAPGARETLVSGTLLQCDIIVGGTPPYSGIHTEDTLAIADAGLRKELQEKYPAVWSRIVARKQRMAELGYELHADVLPLSDMQGCVAPFLLQPNLVLALGR
ncbi:MAG: M24 family metallopeptidase [Bacillota bacterium]|jgi:Xaa-Pro aminopeptidase|nr:M24 family metallopeptidase [Bacillota bacterium]HHT90624.1 M24 family metallopeptidase [Bacillota bacterium]